MASGHRQEMLGPAMETDPAEPVRGFLLHEPEEEPGTVFAYNQPCTYTVAAIVQRRAGVDLVDYLRPRLFDPLGIGPVGWDAHPEGRSLGFSGLFATTEAVAKLGQLYLDRGRWEGRQLLPEGWVEQASTRWIDTPREESTDWRCGYGFQVWHARHGYRGDGAFGQFCVILPEQDVVLATTASTEAMQAVLDAAWEHLLPAIGDGAGDPAADERLERRLAALALPATEGAAEPTDETEWAGRYAASPPTNGPALESVELERDGTGWRVRLSDADGGTAEAPIRAGAWAVGESGDGPPIAVSGGWRDGRLRLSVLFVETPHRLEVDLHSSARRAAVRWAPPPLDLGESRLAGLQAPRPLR
jgi:hypothetical protein